jgi:hypothetical protein
MGQLPWHFSFGWPGKSQFNLGPGARLFGDAFPTAPINSPTILDPPIRQIIWSERHDDSSHPFHLTDRIGRTLPKSDPP